jgi:hypothetical protein
MLCTIHGQHEGGAQPPTITVLSLDRLLVGAQIGGVLGLDERGAPINHHIICPWELYRSVTTRLVVVQDNEGNRIDQ